MPDPAAELLDLPAKRGRLHALAAAGILDSGQLDRGLRAIGLRATRSSWSEYLYWHALIVGAVLLVAGIIFFVAANWSALSGATRMSLVGALMVTATLVGGYLGDTLPGRVASSVGGLLFGPLLAVYGQVYQTGADAWELFAVWSIVLVAYGALVRFAGTWVVALLCLHVACFAWIDQELGSAVYEGRGAWVVAILGLVDAVIVGVAERFSEGGEREVVIHTAGFMGIGVLLPFGVITIFKGLPDSGLLGLVLLGGALLAIWLVYRWRRPVLGMLAGFAGVITILVSTLVAKILFDELQAALLGVALLGAIICGQVWGFTRWLLSWRREHGEQGGAQ